MPLSFKPMGRTLLTLLDTTDESTTFQIPPNDERGSMLRVLKLLSSPRFAHRPPANINEVAKHITAMRNEWDTE